MQKQQGLIIKKLGQQEIRVFLAERLSYHWKQLVKKKELLLSSFARVGLSLPIDGSKDDQIKIQACDHIPFAPIVIGKLENVKPEDKKKSK